MRRFVVLDKKVGETPLEALQAWKKLYPQYAEVPASYAGRLDPMASGKLLVLLGDECKRQKHYTGLDKIYEIEVLLDIGSDTGDILGIVKPSSTQSHVTATQLKTALEALVGTHTLPYPVFSSKTVGGRPLFLYALEHTLDTIEIPTHEETTYSLQLLGMTEVSNDELAARVFPLLNLAPVSDEPSKALGADFRINDVRPSWEAALTPPRTYQILRLRVACGSGTYMRTLAGRIGTELGTEALALSIRRTAIGRNFKNPLARLFPGGI